ncbi:MAG: IS630 family transposase [Candidatus Binatus sp.]|uniref:IS630 family transposase n=1 Tax=Candidatus Binatus sp. TaxID=2811406 RepID=UPI003C737B40
MDGSIRLSLRERKACLKVYRSARAARRALIVLLLAEGRSYRQIRTAVLASPTLIAAIQRDFRQGGVDSVLKTERREASVPYWLIVVMRWLVSFTPRDFGFFRSRWSCELLALLLHEREGIRLSPESVRRGMRRMEFVWRRPRPVVGPRDPEHATKLRQIQRMMAHLPSDETVVFQDEVDVHLNPKIGPCWMVRGEQAEVVTPGNNEKRHLAGSLHWRTGRLLLSAPSRRRDATLFVAHLDDLRRQLRSYCVIHVVCDNASFHNCRAVRDFLARHPGRIVLHSLPKYAPETNPIERIWWHLHETITRNHRCRTIEELLREVYDWADAQQSFFFQTASFRNTYKLAA